MNLKFNISDWVTVAVFTMLVPLFFIYFALKDIGIASGLGGYFALAISIGFVILIPRSMLLVLGKPSIRLIDIVFPFLMLSLAIIQIATVALDNDNTAQMAYLPVSVAWVTLFLFACNLHESKFLEKVALLSYALTCAVVVYFSLGTFAFSLGTAIQYDAASANPTYQFFAMFFIVGLAVVVFLSSQRTAEIALISSLPILLLIGSRTDMAVMLLTYFIMKVLNGLSIRVILGIFSASVVFYFSVSYAMTSEYNRFVVYLSGGSGENQSVRAQTNSYALDVISQAPIFGDAGNYPLGYYAHSIISVWVDFGLLGFAAYIVTLTLFMCYAYRLRGIENSKGGAIGSFVLAFFTSVCVALAVTKSADYYLVPFALGLVKAVYYLNLRTSMADLPLFGDSIRGKSYVRSGC